VTSATCSEQKLLTGRFTGSRVQRVDKDVGPLLGENQSILKGDQTMTQLASALVGVDGVV
jgi:hypothetical protein